MKKLLASLFVLGLISAFAATTTQANEGTVELSSSVVSCEGVSLWNENSYRITGRCEGLVYPYQTQYEHYVIWAKTDVKGDLVRIDEVERGYFDGSVAANFGSVYITAETSGLPRRPSDKTVVSGKIVGFSFDNTVTEVAPAATPAPAAADNGTMVVQNGATQTVATSSTVGKVVGRILSSLLVIIVVVVVLVIGASLIFRRRGSVSS